MKIIEMQGPAGLVKVPEAQKAIYEANGYGIPKPKTKSSKAAKPVQEKRASLDK